jgi:hypothetical protein
MKFSKQRMQIHWKEEMTTKKQRKQYLWKLVEDFKRRTTDRDSAFLRKYEQKFVEITKPVKFFYGGSSLFIGAGGGSFKNSSRFDRWEISGGHMSTPTFRGWHFLLKFWDFRGIGSLESTRYPEELVLGSSGKPVTLETLSLTKFVKWVFRNLEHVKI